MVSRVQKLIDLRDAHMLRTVGYLFNQVPRADLALLENPKIEAGSSMGHHQRRHLLVAHSDAQPIAGDAWLRDLKDRAANPISVSYADIAVCQPSTVRFSPNWPDSKSDRPRKSDQYRYEST